MLNSTIKLPISARLLRDSLLVLLLGTTIGFLVNQEYSEFIFILAISFAILIVSVYLMQKTINVFNISRLTIPAFWYLTYLFMIYFASFIVFYETDIPGRYAYLFAVQSTMLTVPLGIITVNIFCRFDKDEINEFFTLPVVETKPGIHREIVYALFMGFVVLLALQYLLSLSKIPLFYMLIHPGEYQELAVLREESFKLLDPRWSSTSSTSLFYIYLFTRTLLFPFLIMVSLGYYLVSRNNRWLMFFLITLSTGIIYAASSIARAPVAAIILRVSFFIYVFNRGKLSKKMAVAILILILIFPIIITKMAYGSEVEFIEALKRVVIRLCYTPAADLFDYFEIFPYHHDYVYGQALLKPILVALGLSNFYIENYVYKFKYPTGLVSGHSNAAFQSNLHADFGVIGVLLGGFLSGMLMQGIQISILRNKKTVMNIATYSFMVYAFWVLNSGSITSVLFVNGVIPLFFLILIIRGMEELFSHATRKLK